MTGRKLLADPGEFALVRDDSIHSGGVVGPLLSMGTIGTNLPLTLHKRESG